MARDYGWERLKRRGDWVLNRDTTVNQVARLAKRYAARHLPDGSHVVTITVPDGTVTFVAYLGEATQAPEPQPKMPTERQMEQHARRQSREAAALDKRNAAMDEGAEGLRKIASHVDGYEPWNGK